MEIFKPFEVAFRRMIVWVLRLVIRRNKPLPKNIDYNASRFLFLRQDRIGDVLVSTPLIHTLKQYYPNAVIDFLLGSNNYMVLDNEQLIRKCWVYRKNLSGVLRVLKSIRREEYDFVIDLMDNPSTTSTIICLLSNGKWTVGFSKQNDFTYDLKVPLLSRGSSHIVDRLGMLLTVFGIEPTKNILRIHYTVSKESETFAQRFFQQQQLSDKFIIGLNISPTKGARFWGISNFQNLIRSLSLDLPNICLIILCQPVDRNQVEKIVEPFTNVLLSPETKTFDQFAAFVKSVDLLVTPDTSAVHLAAAFNIPAVVLYVQSNKDLFIWKPYGSISETLVTDVDDLRTISHEEVYNAVRKLIQRIQSESTDLSTAKSLSR